MVGFPSSLKCPKCPLIVSSEYTTLETKMRSTPETEDRIVRAKEAMRITGMSRAHLYRAAAEPGFPPKYRLSTRCVGWMHSDLIAWLKSRKEEVQA